MVITAPESSSASFAGPLKVLGPDEIHLYFTYPDQVTSSELLNRYESLLSEDELERMSRFYFDRGRQQYLVSHALLRTILSAYCPVEPADWQFVKNKYGRPGISGPQTQLPIHFNLSHTDGLSVCAFSLHDTIGVDLEDSRRNVKSGFRNLASYFSPVEIEELCSLPEECQRHRFYDYWTLKEAYIKARGAGFAIPLDKFSFLFRENRLKGFRVDAEWQNHEEDWQFWRMKLAEHYRIALAVRSGDSVIKITAMESVPLQSNNPVDLQML